MCFWLDPKRTILNSSLAVTWVHNPWTDTHTAETIAFPQLRLYTVINNDLISYFALLPCQSHTSKIGGGFLVGGEGALRGYSQKGNHLVLISFFFIQSTVRFMEIMRLLLFQHKAFQESMYSTTEASEVMIFGMKLLFTNSVLQMESITFYVVTAHHLDIRQEATASSQIKFLILWQ